MAPNRWPKRENGLAVVSVRTGPGTVGVCVAAQCNQSNPPMQPEGARVSRRNAINPTRRCSPRARVCRGAMQSNPVGVPQGFLSRRARSPQFSLSMLFCSFLSSLLCASVLLFA